MECVGDAYTFQGDERDVMFLSMVKALDSDKLDDTVRALADENTKRRFNVAASRARDQMFLFHSIPLSSFTNQEDWRWRLLNWFYNPQTETLKAGLDSLEKEVEAGRASPFSYAVGKAIIERGYQVIPEFPVIGYRIDLVIQGENARLAVECDGDQYHTLERWDNDQVREAQLRRAGWEFWRVTGSSYYRHKEQALESLWEKLDKMGIKPMI
jgi:very-short-patch-repair endonuclease